MLSSLSQCLCLCQVAALCVPAFCRGARPIGHRCQSDGHWREENSPGGEAGDKERPLDKQQGPDQAVREWPQNGVHVCNEDDRSVA